MKIASTDYVHMECTAEFSDFWCVDGINRLDVQVLEPHLDDSLCAAGFHLQLWFHQRRHTQAIQSGCHKQRPLRADMKRSLSSVSQATLRRS